MNRNDFIEKYTPTNKYVAKVDADRLAQEIVTDIELLLDHEFTIRLTKLLRNQAKSKKK
jgi:hypothetical protein